MTTQPPSFVHYAEMLSDKVGGQALGCSDQWFAPCVNLISHSNPIWAEGKYVDTGKWMDGWETKRHNNTYDWCILRLGITGIIKGFEVDTAFFTGNYPPFASIEALCDDNEPTFAQLSASEQWSEILPKSNLGPGCKQYFAIESTTRWTHLRLKIYPDGGVARLRVYGLASKDWSLVFPGELVDLAAIESGGVVINCSDMYFGHKNNIIMPGRSVNMGDGWETKRRRGPGYDWLVLKLGAPGNVRRIEVDTNWFKGNFPTSCSIDGAYSTDTSVERVPTNVQWNVVLPNTPLTGHRRHLFQRELKNTDLKLTHIRLNIFPDGGVSRLRVHCVPDLTEATQSSSTQ
ncbi:hypothetical protein SAMD00019534_076570 [Acytostelium subglobosum LB1]|uniref:hypothetical protein n=1 Tax=Acytostelium subglobosum LB1 TaxID=1410327 RepID=UPI000644DDF5|nr:hypothetical protein SAMD00019534_076570 [Acytostelium subglobosum LB1]GAM24482.1 hypothetical protein SAMD00019534_076570 [Acytostelium subglobosum LB1]|eukprot:XP_012752808.1 hypothetical protein SAMD00019534_076570 [Acytostelium subglobosum LB1]